VRPDAFATAPSGLDLSLATRTLEQRGPLPQALYSAVRTTRGIEASMPRYSGETLLVPGDPDNSLILTLANERGPGQMPPVGTVVVDSDAMDTLRAWIMDMTGTDDVSAITRAHTPVAPVQPN
jgi:hypothetical protein